MIRFVSAFFITFLILCATAQAQYTPPQPADTGYILGFNWYGTVPNNNIYTDSIGFNNYHLGAPNYPATLSGFNGTLTYKDDQCIYALSGSQRLFYTPLPRPQIGNLTAHDTLTHNYFLNVDTTLGADFPTSSNPTYWQVNSSTDSSNVVLMSQNEMGGEWNPAYFPDSLILAVRMQVTSLAPADSDTVVSVIVQFDTTWDLGGYRLGVLDTLNIKWGWFNRADTDTCFFSNLALGHKFAIPSNFKYRNEGGGNGQGTCYNLGVDCECGTELTVMSRRHVTIRLAGIIISDSTADALIAGAPVVNSDGLTAWSGYDDESVARVTMFDSLRNAVQDSAKAIDLACTGGLSRYYYYFVDEMTMSQFSSSSVLNQILDTTGVCEVEGDYMNIPRYLAQVKPKTTICPWFYSSGGRAAMADTGIFNKLYSGIDNTNFSGATVNSGIESLYGCSLTAPPDSAYCDIIGDSYVMNHAWYIPRTTLSTNYHGVEYGYYSSDFLDSTQRISAYDYSSTGHAIFAFPQTAAGQALQLTTMVPYGLHHWWGDIFNFAQIADTQTYFYGVPFVPENLSAECNSMMAFGASGIWFFANNLRNNPNPWWLNFTDETGMYSTDDSAFVPGDTMPTMWHRNCLWLKSFSQWLRTYAKEIYPMTWSGGYICGIQNTGSFGQVQTLDSTYGVFNIVNPSQSYEGRYMLNHWYKDSTQHDTLVMHTVPDDTMFIVYSQFSDSIEPTTQYLYTVNLFQDDRSLDGHWIANSDSVFIERGTRVVYTKMALDSATSQYYTLTTLTAGFPDTQIAYNGVYRQTLLPGGASVTRITPFCSYAERNIMSDSGNAFGNGVHEVKHADGGYRTVYVRNDTVYERKMSECGISGEKMVEPGKASNNTFEYAYTCASLFDSSRTIAADSFLFCVCANPTIAEGRSGKTDEDLLVWEEDSWYKRPTHDTIVYKTIRAIPYSYSTDMPTAPEPYMIADSMTLGKSRTFLATPVVTGTNYGYIFAWADSSKGIKVSAMMGGGGSFYYSDSICTINGLTNHQPALFPSLSWGTDVALSPTGHIIFAPSAHLVWQQPDSQNVNEIWHMTIDVFFTDETECTWFGENPIEQVSDKNAWWCDNTMPCVSADGQDSTSGIMGTKIPSKNTAHIVWHAYILNDTINANRICYRNREFHYGQSYYSPTFIFASGIEQFFEPSIYVPPVPKVLTAPATIGNFVSVVNVCWFASHDAYVNHDSMKIATSSFAPGWSSNYPFFTSFGINNYIRSYPLLGLHPTLSYSLANDVSPSTVSQSGLSQYQLQSTEYGTFISDTNYSNALLNSVVIHPQKNSYTSGGCSNWSPQVVLGTTQIIGSEPDYFGLPPVQPISIAQEIDGNGVIENTLVRTVNLILAPEVPLVISRAIGARDAGVNTALLSTGHSVELLIELVDSVGDVPLKTLDSFLITTPSDTGWRTGTISYMPDLSFVGFPVYVRARIIADTNAARWNVLSMNELAPDTLNDGGGFAKPLRTTNGVPAGLDSIGLTLYPNPATPANPNTRIMYSVGVEDANNVTELKIYNMIGEDVTTLFSGVKAAGRYAVTFYASDQLPSGEYIVTVREQTHTESKLLIITK